MKKLLVALAAVVLTACSSSTEVHNAQDSSRASDSIHKAQSLSVDSAAATQKSTIDSMQQDNKSKDSTQGK